MDQFYPIIVTVILPEDGGGYMGFAPDLPGCMSHGDTPEEAFASAREAVLEWIDEAKAAKREIPAPGTAGARARKERSELIEIIKEQNDAIEKMSKDFEVLRLQIREVVERTGDLTVWSGFAVASINQHAEDSVH